MIELNPIEKAALAGKPTADERAKQALEEAKQQKQSAKLEDSRRQEQLARQEAEAQKARAIQDQVDAAVAEVENELVNDLKTLLSPILEFKPGMRLSRESYAHYLASLDKAEEINTERAALVAECDKLGTRINALQDDKAMLYTARQNGEISEQEAAGRMGLLMMDIETLEGVKRKYNQAINALSEPPNTAFELRAWNESIRVTRNNALNQITTIVSEVGVKLRYGLPKH